MDYYLRVTIEVRSYDERKGRDRTYTHYQYLPAWSKEDAAAMVHALHASVNGNARLHGAVHHRTFDVVAGIHTGKGRVYLDLPALEQIAEEYTAPHQMAAE